MIVPDRQTTAKMENDDDAAPASPLMIPPLNTVTSTAIIPIRTPRFELPQGWEIQEVPRAVGNHVDKYYFQSGSNRRFRSLKEVERYISGQEYDASAEKSYKRYNRISKSGQRKMVVSGGVLLKLDEISDREQLTIASPSSAAGTSQFALPDGWVVKEVPSRYRGLTTKYYYEPGTGQRFRSLTAVERHVSEKDIENGPLAKMFKLGNCVKKSGSRKRLRSEQKIDGSTSDFSRTHIKINWVLDDPAKNKWDAYIGQSIVPESIRQLWEEKFKSSINSNDPK